jgi:hypothetical protein
VLIPSLTSLDVSFTQVTNTGLDLVYSLANLRDLALGGNKITDAGLPFLKLVPGLQRIDLHGRQRTNPLLGVTYRRRPRRGRHLNSLA